MRVKIQTKSINRLYRAKKTIKANQPIKSTRTTKTKKMNKMDNLDKINRINKICKIYRESQNRKILNRLVICKIQVNYQITHILFYRTNNKEMESMGYLLRGLVLEPMQMKLKTRMSIKTQISMEEIHLLMEFLYRMIELLSMLLRISDQMMNHLTKITEILIFKRISTVRICRILQIQIMKVRKHSWKVK